MSTINKALYDALLVAQVPEELATAASAPEDLKSLQSDVATLREKVASIDAKQNITLGIVLLMLGLMLKQMMT